MILKMNIYEYLSNIKIKEIEISIMDIKNNN